VGACEEGGAGLKKRTDRCPSRFALATQEARDGRGSAKPATTREQCSTARRRSQPVTPLFGKATPTPDCERTPITVASQLIRILCDPPL
jgi:hypothetical protein